MLSVQTGRIIEIYTGKDDVVRSARVKMAHGDLNRPVVKLDPVFYDGVPRSKTAPATLAPLQQPKSSDRKNFWS